MSEEFTIPTLTLTPDVETEEVQAVAVHTPAQLEEAQFSPEELQMIEAFSDQIDVTNSKAILMYGAAAQKHVAEFADSALQGVRAKDLGEVGKLLGDLMVDLKGFDNQTEGKGLFSVFKNAGKQMEQLKARYGKLEGNVGSIARTLEDHQVRLLKDVSMLDKMYDMNKKHFKETSMYIVAGEKKLAQVMETDLPKLREKAQASRDPMDAQYANDMAQMCDRFDKKLYDLKLTRQVSIQMAPQIRLLQNSDGQLVEKIQTTLVSTIPLWKNQMVLALGIANQASAIHAQRAVSDVTNQLLKKNAETLKQGTIEAARENERGIIDIETLKETNRKLIETLDEVLRIQQDGRQKRRDAEVQLQTIEGELKNKLLELRG